MAKVKRNYILCDYFSQFLQNFLLTTSKYISLLSKYHYFTKRYLNNTYPDTLKDNPLEMRQKHPPWALFAKKKEEKNDWCFSDKRHGNHPVYATLFSHSPLLHHKLWDTITGVSCLIRPSNAMYRFRTLSSEVKITTHQPQCWNKLFYLIKMW